MHHDNCIAFFRHNPVTKSDVHGKCHDLPLIGTVEDMIYEMNSAMQDMIFRWNFCREAYAGPVRSRDGKRQIKDLAAEGIEYLKEIRKGALWKDEPVCDQ